MIASAQSVRDVKFFCETTPSIVKMFDISVPCVHASSMLTRCD